jgi:TatD DNase family protein
MIETDAPFLAPRDLTPRVRRNEPKYLLHIMHAVAQCRGEAVDQLAPKILDATRAFFRLSG